jgi:hypothetical protein
MKHKFLLLVLFSGMIYANALTQPVIRGQKVIGGESWESLSSMYLTRYGGLIVGGSSTSNKSGEKTENNRGNYAEDYWIVKLDHSYKIQWDKTIGGNSYDDLASLQQTTDGGYILGGHSSSSKSGEKTENIRGGDDYWIVKLNGSGKIQWDKTIGGSALDGLTSLQQTRDGGYILGGISRSNISGEKTEDNRCDCTDPLYLSDDYWVVKLDSNGTIQWDKTIGGNRNDDLSSLQQTRDGGYILGGSSNSSISGEKTQNSMGDLCYQDYWVVKLDSKGNIQWDKTIGGRNNDHLTSLQETSEGGYILGGYSFSNISGEKTENGRGRGDYWVVKLNDCGKVQWDKTIGGNNYDYLTTLQQTMDGGYILGGYSASNKSGEKTENSRGVDDFWIVKLNGSGKIQWNKTIGGSGYDLCSSVKEITRNRYVIGGSSNSPISGDKKQRSRGDYDYWLVQLVYKPNYPVIAKSQNESNIVTPKINGSNFTVYPNPAKDVLYMQTNGKAIVSLTDQSGKVLLTTTISGSSIINVAGLKPGLYYLKNGTTGTVQKVVVAK